MSLFYIDAKYPVFEQNVIVDDDDVFIIYCTEKKKTANKELVYYKCRRVGSCDACGQMGDDQQEAYHDPP